MPRPRSAPRARRRSAHAVKAAAEALGYTEEKATVILITDGIETCDADPCQIGTDLEAQGIDFTAHVIGFGLSDAGGPGGRLPRRKYRRQVPAGERRRRPRRGAHHHRRAGRRAVARHRARRRRRPSRSPIQLQANRSDGRGRRPAAVGLRRGLGRLPRRQRRQSPGEWVRTEYGGRIKIDLDPGQLHRRRADRPGARPASR